jgi:hypothetical protein
MLRPPASLILRSMACWYSVRVMVMRGFEVGMVSRVFTVDAFDVLNASDESDAPDASASS